MTIWSEALPYFPEHELACRHCGVIKLDRDFASLLPALRLAWGKPLTPTSVCRCPEHNKSVSGHPNSLHLTENPRWGTDGSMAADIRWADWEVSEKLQFARTAHQMGFRIGLHNTFCHIDLGRKLGIGPRPFIYGQWAGHFGAEDVL